MSTSPQTPFDTLFAQLTQGMSPPRPSRPVVNVVGYDVDAQHTQAERAVWILRQLTPVFAPFQIPDAATPYREAWDWDVSIYGGSLERLATIHGLLTAWLDLLIGPATGCAPSDDAAPAILRGTADLLALSYPYSGLIGKTLDLAAPLARSLAFPAVALDGPQDIATAVNLAAQAMAPDVRLRARIVPVGGAQQYLELVLPTNPLGTVGATLTLNPAPASSACTLLGFSSGASNLTATGTPPTTPYRPGYVVGPGQPRTRGGDASAQSWGTIVPVRLYTPIVSLQDQAGVIADTPFQVSATGETDPAEIVVDIN